VRAGLDVLSTNRRPSDDAGFTLVELLISIVILGVIAAPLVGVVLGYLQNTDATAARMNESHDAQIAAAYFAQDVQAVGVRDYADTSTAFFPLKQSVETNVATAGGLYPCGAAGLPDAVVRLAWDEFGPGGAAGPATQTRVAYVVQNGTELHRVVCKGSATPTADVVVAHNLVAPFATVTCADKSGAPTPCTGSGSAVPSAVSLALTISDPKSSAGSSYPVTLTGQRRQS
jgi:prepilin-type N-terminal cleavage/methylation domain-containing protein